MSKNTESYMKMRLGFTFINFPGERASKQVIHTLISLFQIHPSGLYCLKLKEKQFVERIAIWVSKTKLNKTTN